MNGLWVILEKPILSFQFTPPVVLRRQLVGKTGKTKSVFPGTQGAEVQVGSLLLPLEADSQGFENCVLTTDYWLLTTYYLNAALAG